MTYKSFKKDLSVIILCGGRGERLKPITNNIPKPLIKIGGQEILGYILNHLQSYNIQYSSVLTGYKQEKINNFITNNFKKNVSCFYTGQKIDIISRIKKSLKFQKKYILICYGDTLLDISIDKLIKFHLNNRKLPTMSIHETKTNFGVVKFNKKGLVTNFLEKPKLNLWINVGYFIFEREHLKKLCSKFKSFKNLLDNLGSEKKIKAFKHDGNHITINTALELEEAKKKIKNFKKK